MKKNLKLDDVNVVFIPGGLSKESSRLLTAILAKRKKRSLASRKKKVKIKAK